MSKYVVDDNKNFERAFNQEEVLAILQQAIDDGTLENIDPNSAVASKLRSLLTGKTYNLEYVTTAIYNQLVAEGRDDPNTIYYLTDDNTPTAIRTAIAEINQRLDNLGFKTGTVTISSGNGTITSQSLVKQGKMANLFLTFTGNVAEFQLPVGFYPQQETKIILVRDERSEYDLYALNYGERQDKGKLIPAGAYSKEWIAKTDGTIIKAPSGWSDSVRLTSDYLSDNLQIERSSDSQLGEARMYGGWQII